MPAKPKLNPEQADYQRQVLATGERVAAALMHHLEGVGSFTDKDGTLYQVTKGSGPTSFDEARAMFSIEVSVPGTAHGSIEFTFVQTAHGGIPQSQSAPQDGAGGANPSLKRTRRKRRAA